MSCIHQVPSLELPKHSLQYIFNHTKSKLFIGGQQNKWTNVHVSAKIFNRARSDITDYRKQTCVRACIVGPCVNKSLLLEYHHEYLVDILKKNSASQNFTSWRHVSQKIFHVSWFLAKVCFSPKTDLLRVDTPRRYIDAQ